MEALGIWRYVTGGIVVIIVGFAVAYVFNKKNKNIRRLTEPRRTAAGVRESKLNNLIDAIQRFTRKLELPKFPNSSYRRQILSMEVIHLIGQTPYDTVFIDCVTSHLNNYRLSLRLNAICKLG